MREDTGGVGTHLPRFILRSMCVVLVFIAVFAFPVGAKLARRGGGPVPDDGVEVACLMLVLPAIGSLIAGLVLFLLGHPYDDFFGASVLSFLLVEATLWLAGEEMLKVAATAAVPPGYQKLLLGAVVAVWPLVSPIALTMTFAAA